MAMFFGIRVPIAAIVTTAVCATAAASASAQDEDALKAFFEGKAIVVMVDMPGTSDGVDIGVSSDRLLDSQRYVQRLKTYGTAIHAGEPVTVTLVKVKKDHIEFQLAGGGFGTFGDDTSTSVYMAPIGKSNREKDLENAVRDETNPRRRRELERELDAVREPRERENRRIEIARLEAEDRKREVVAEKRRRGGSRFNLRYDDEVPASVTPQDVMAALAPYVVFAGFPGAQPRVDEIVRETAPRDGLSVLRKGMSRADAERTLGMATSVTSRQEGSVQIVSMIFLRNTERITAEFVEDVLVRYVTASR